MKSSHSFIRIAAGAVLGPLLLLYALSAPAQVPPHRPGEICLTKKLWCWQKPPGPLGGDCTCPTPFGLLSGKLV